MPSEVGGVTRIILLSLDDDLAPGRGKLIAVSGSATGLKWNAGKTAVHAR